MSSHDAPAPVAAVAEPALAGPQASPTQKAASPSSMVPISGLTVGSADDPAEDAADRMAAGALSRLRGATATAGTETDAHAHDPGCGHLRRSATPTSSATVGLAGGALDA